MEIGGYFGLELQEEKAGFHTSPYRFNSGRAALGFLLTQLKPSKVYLPFYTCNALLAPFEQLQVPYVFYQVNEAFEIEVLPELAADELLLYINYYDIKRTYSEKLADRYGHQFISDCTQAYFVKGNGKSWVFNSCRKFFGVPDGADLYVPDGIDLMQAYRQLPENTNYTIAHLLARFNGETKKGYPFFQENEIRNGEQIVKMSKLTQYLLSTVDEEKARLARKENFEFLHAELKATNQLKLQLEDVPESSFYPYLPEKLLKKHFFWEQDIFIPHFWNDCLDRNEVQDFEQEITFSQHLLPIPIDHRYGPMELSRIIHLINKLNAHGF
jgi:hypothetical protein